MVLGVRPKEDHKVLVRPPVESNSAPSVTAPRDEVRLPLLRCVNHLFARTLTRLREALRQTQLQMLVVQALEGPYWAALTL